MEERAELIKGRVILIIVREVTGGHRTESGAC